MKPVSLGAVETRSMGKPAGWKDSECGSLSIHDYVNADNRPGMLSRWELEEGDLDKLQRGAPVWLSVMGTSHPPVCVFIGDPQAPEQLSFQARVGLWMEACFTPEIIADKLERADRFIEESLELVQATGYSAERAHALVDYVFGRAIGEAEQEVGGVAVTLAALCNPHGIDMEATAEKELARVWTKIDQIRAKQAAKPVGSALPQ
jgi:NTP pyrophosphatase (non-canonical NTP hydrolase)